MLNDRQRNHALKLCIESLDLKSKTIFEIGTGAGLTALYFAKAGAEKITSCETNSDLFRIAQRTVRKSGFSNKIELLNKSSKCVIKDGDLKAPPDVIFTETLDCGVIGEGFWEIAQDIQAICNSQTLVIPAVIFQFGYLISCQRIDELNRIYSSRDHDLTLLNYHSTRSYFPIWPERFDVKCLTASRLVGTYSYHQTPQAKTGCVLAVQDDGVCHGMVTYFHAHFGKQIIHNYSLAGHWHRAFHPLGNPIHLRRGQTLVASLAQDGALTLTEKREHETGCSEPIAC